MTDNRTLDSGGKLGLRGCTLPTIPWALFGRRRVAVIGCLLILVAAVGCASTKVSRRQTLVTERLPRPAHIWVYNFVGTASDVPGYSALADRYADQATHQTAEQIALGRKIGAVIAEELVAQIRAMGLPAEQVSTGGTSAQINDIVLRGYILSIDEGSQTERVAIGFGSGASEMRTAVEGFQMTARGLRKVGSGTVDAGGGKSPGAALGLAGLIATANPAGLIVSSGVKVYGEVTGSSKVEGRARDTANEIAEALKKRFEQEGWIK